MQCDCRKRLCVTAAAHEEAGMPEAKKPTQSHAALRMLHEGGVSNLHIDTRPALLEETGSMEVRELQHGVLFATLR